MASSIISILALLFTIGSFYWVFATKGRLHTYEPYSYTARVFEDNLLTLRLPLVLANSGARPLVVQDLRLFFFHDDGRTISFKWSRSFTSLRKPNSEETSELPAIFVVTGRSAGQYFLEFQPVLPVFRIEQIEYRVRVEAKLTNHEKWKSITEFKLRAKNIPKGVRGNQTYSNAPIILNEEEEIEIQAIRDEIRSRDSSSE